MSYNFDQNLSFGDDRPLTGLRSLKHPFVVIAHCAFRGAAIVFYVFANILSLSFIIQFLVLLALLSADFWTVKNVTGRLLVGLRWWNFVDSEGKNHWKFESAKDPSRFDIFEIRIFWGALVVAPVFWTFLVIVAFFTFKWEWMIVALMGDLMNLANLYGYLRCKWNNTQELTNYLTKYAFLSMLTRQSQQPTTSNIQTA
uniref:Golgi apparatus membrane protein TVP23 homolog n=1 Tax=Acrobeloides nanus TaxID=290746 RepID=A0A914EPA8_9BILA